MDSLASQLDELHLANDKTIAKTLESDEKILLSCTLFKFNRKGKRQERNFMLTTKAIYNLSKTSIKRRIEVSKVQGVTVSKMGSEFIIHVPDEYDYRYSSFDKRDRLLELVVKAYCNVNKGSLLHFYYKDEISLEKYCTTQPDRKKGISRMPTDSPVLMNEDLYKKNLEGEKLHKEDMRKKTGTLFAKKKGEVVTIDDFNLLKVLGRGAFGKVMLVEKKDSKEIYAMKSIRKEEIIDKEQIEHTKTEKMILEHANHPFLVNLAYAFQTPDKIFFVMQFMRGGELFQHLRVSRKFDEPRAKYYASEILLALGHLHSKDIVYRDLKPENILMDDSGHVSLTDFGMAKIIRKDEVAQSFCGTPEYLAPEIITSEGHGKPADWWSFGILIYEMMYGIPPFYNQNQSMMFQMIRDSDVRFPVNPATSEHAKDIILKLLNKDQKKRLGSISDVDEIKAHPWFKDIDFDKLLKRELPTPFRPKVAGDLWVDNFDEEFTKEEAINSYQPGTNMKLINEYKDDFKDFDTLKKH